MMSHLSDSDLAGILNFEDAVAVATKIMDQAVADQIWAEAQSLHQADFDCRRISMWREFR